MSNYNLGFNYLVMDLKNDFRREIGHMMFYLKASNEIEGLHKLEYSEFFKNKSNEERDHVSQWSAMILGLKNIDTGIDYTPIYHDYVLPFMTTNKIYKIHDAIVGAIALEENVVENYVLRLNQIEDLEKHQKTTDVVRIRLFIEEQILDSRGDLDLLNEIKNGF